MGCLCVCVRAPSVYDTSLCVLAVDLYVILGPFAANRRAPKGQWTKAKQMGDRRFCGSLFLVCACCSALLLHSASSFSRARWLLQMSRLALFTACLSRAGHKEWPVPNSLPRSGDASLSRSSSTARALSRAGTFFNPFGPCFLSFFLYYFAQTSWRTNVASQKSQTRCLSVLDKCIGGLCVCVCALSHLQRPEQSERPAKHASTGASVA